MKKTYINELLDKIGQKVTVAGWVATRRDHGKLIFIDLRDSTGYLQVVFPPDTAAYKEAQKMKNEDVVEIEGTVRERPKGMENPKLETGKIELNGQSLKIISQAKTPPFELNKDTKDISEDIRMKYRYLDIRTDRVRNNLRLRHKVISFMRKYMEDRGFIEIETPILTKSTPEGARDFVVPSRSHPGQFYALPQSPQQFKQLLMVGGIERYFQIAKCLRDEDPRGDRQVEHTQLDIEMSFVEQKDVMDLVENMMVEMVKKVTPDKKISQIPFPILSYDDAISKYKTDKPDLRKNKKDINELAFCWVKDFPFFEKNKEGQWTFTHNPFSSPLPEDKEKLLKGDFEKIKTTQYDLVLNGMEVGGGSIRSHEKEVLTKVLEILGYNTPEIKEKFGHILEAFEYGVPPHGGIAPGIDRIVMILTGEPNIREVIAFPKTGDGRDLMMGAPGEISNQQLKELHIQVDE